VTEERWSAPLRPIAMKRLLGPCLLAVVVLAGCGDASSSEATDASPSTGTPMASVSSSPTKGGGSAQDFQTVALVSQTAAGGKVDPNAVRLDDRAARDAFVSQFERRGLDRKIERAIASATVPAGYSLLGAVVAIGCDVPPGVTVTVSPDGYVITAQKAASPLQECFAPVTTVAIVAGPA
jgi:hypothetical protein